MQPLPPDVRAGRVGRKPWSLLHCARVKPCCKLAASRGKPFSWLAAVGEKRSKKNNGLNSIKERAGGKYFLPANSIYHKTYYATGLHLKGLRLLIGLLLCIALHWAGERRGHETMQPNADGAKRQTHGRATRELAKRGHQLWKKQLKAARKRQRTGRTGQMTIHKDGGCIYEKHKQEASIKGSVRG
jgi:hypothetical protein